MASTRDKTGRPIVVVTGMGVVTSLGAGKDDNWKKLTAGQSGIKKITRFATDALKTTMAGTVDFVPVEPFCSSELTERMAHIVAEEAITEAKIIPLEEARNDIAVKLIKGMVSRGAEIIMPLGGALIPYVVNPDDLARGTGVQVLNTKAISIGFAEMCVRMKVTQSAVTYPRAKLRYEDFTSKM